MVIATGFFDGVHLGHRFVIERLVQAARDRGDESMVVTFGPIPAMSFRTMRVTFASLRPFQRRRISFMG